MHDHPRNDVVAKGDVPDSTHDSDDLPTFVSVAVPKPDVKDDPSDEIMFEDDNNAIGFIPVPTTFDLLKKPSS